MNDPVENMRKIWAADPWCAAETAPRDGTHILVCNGPYSEHWGFAQRPPAVVHWWSNPGEEGFYLSNGGSESDEPFTFTHWMPFVPPPMAEAPR